jgi:lipoyl(octanoyl) transferase
VNEAMPLPQVQWLGRLRYGWAHRLQHARRDAVVAGTAPEAVWMLEHTPVITIGRRQAEVPDPDQLARDRIDLHRTERGGLATYHGPGQLVGYLILDVARRGWTVRGTVSGVERGLITWLNAQSVEAGRRCGHPGVWVGKNKIAALGFHFRRGVSMHGFALNLTTDLRGFTRITPCGITDGGVTSLHALTGRSVDPYEAFLAVGDAVLRGIVDIG